MKTCKEVKTCVKISSHVIESVNENTKNLVKVCFLKYCLVNTKILSHYIWKKQNLDIAYLDTAKKLCKFFSKMIFFLILYLHITFWPFKRLTSNLSLEFTLACTCTCTYVSVCVFTWVNAHTVSWSGQEKSMSGILFFHLPLYFLKQVFDFQLN